MFSTFLSLLYQLFLHFFIFKRENLVDSVFSDDRLFLLCIYNDIKWFFFIQYVKNVFLVLELGRYLCYDGFGHGKGYNRFIWSSFFFFFKYVKMSSFPVVNVQDHP